MTGRAAGTGIDAYLDLLLVELHGRARDVRRALAEAEAHLDDAAAEGVAAGLSREEAESAAIERFGPPRTVARQYGGALGRSGRQVVGELVASFAAVAVVGLLAIGVSGVVAMGMRSAFGDRFVAGDPPGVTYTPARCADLREYQPGAASCEDAASANHADEVGAYRVAAGVLGVMAVVVVLAWRRWRAHRSGPSGEGVAPAVGLVPRAFTAMAAATLFGTVGAGLAVLGLGLLLGTGADAGPGQWLSGAIVSLVVAGWYAVVALRHLPGVGRPATG